MRFQRVVFLVAVILVLPGCDAKYWTNRAGAQFELHCDAIGGVPVWHVERGLTVRQFSCEYMGVPKRWITKMTNEVTWRDTTSR